MNDEAGMSRAGRQTVILGTGGHNVRKHERDQKL